MQLQPRRFVYKRRQKNRKSYFFKSFKNLNFGSSGVQLLQPLHITAKRLFRFKLFLKRASRKADYTKRFVWIKTFPFLPLTKKPIGTRMGKGKGKLECWYATVYPGTILVEFRNLRRGRALYFYHQIKHKMGFPCKMLFNSTRSLPLPISLSKHYFFKTRW